VRTTKTTHNAWHVRLAEDDPWLARKTQRWSARCTPCSSEKPNNGGSHWWDQAKRKKNGIEELPGHDLDISGYYFTIFHNISSTKWLCSLISHGNISPVPSPFFTPKKNAGILGEIYRFRLDSPHLEQLMEALILVIFDVSPYCRPYCWLYTIWLVVWNIIYFSIYWK